MLRSSQCRCKWSQCGHESIISVYIEELRLKYRNGHEAMEACSDLRSTGASGHGVVTILSYLSTLKSIIRNTETINVEENVEGLVVAGELTAPRIFFKFTEADREQWCKQLLQEHDFGHSDRRSRGLQRRKEIPTSQCEGSQTNRAHRIQWTAGTAVTGYEQISLEAAVNNLMYALVIGQAICLLDGVRGHRLHTQLHYTTSPAMKSGSRPSFIADAKLDQYCGRVESNNQRETMSKKKHGIETFHALDGWCFKYLGLDEEEEETLKKFAPSLIDDDRAHSHHWTSGHGRTALLFRLTHSLLPLRDSLQSYLALITRLPMTSLSVILNDPESTIPSYCRTAYTSRGPNQARGNNSEFLTLSSTRYLEPSQQRQGDPGLNPSSPSSSNFLESRSLYGGSSRQFATTYTGNATGVGLATSWDYGGSFYAPSLLDPFVLITFPEPGPATVNSEVAALRSFCSQITPLLLNQNRFQRNLNNWLGRKTSLTLSLLELLSQMLKFRETAQNRRREARVLQVKKVRCSCDPNSKLEEDAPCIPCTKAGIPCDYSPPLEGSRAFDVVLRRRQSRVNERPKPRANPRRKQDEIRRFVTPVSAEDFARTLSPSTSNSTTSRHGTPFDGL
ncbi:hypothetical protein BKA70DRAFT_1231682 [Coprinopsis sp. MPI-PUGE-AT-0042]|nr:hypothetical protein BKA70DRAFT_1231682 [Coprinopsis sp. MPI-PUGE-AT-0042]